MNLPILLPISPITENETQQNIAASSTSALEICVLESPTAANVKDILDPLNDLPSKGSVGLFGWMKEAMPGKSILAKVAEKARSSVDTMITTLDPQMKEFICEYLVYILSLLLLKETNMEYIFYYLPFKRFRW